MKKKLNLLKTTVSNLDNEGMKEVKGAHGSNTGCAENDNCVSSPWVCPPPTQYCTVGCPTQTCIGRYTCYDKICPPE